MDRGLRRLSAAGDLAVTWLDWAVLALLAAWVAGSIAWMRRRRKKGKCIGCSGDCSACPHRPDAGKET
ncbi:MAG: FeoB-associated Cys-rich membrane protein [Ruminococcaceae bacterium]|nr:FeoB-associated Cys-rich membrane protein [Oscillospiraceae bacterium]